MTATATDETGARLPKDLDRLSPPSTRVPPDDLTVVAITFNQWHRAAVNDAIRSPGWDEYPLLRGAKPWFHGHDQPRIPWYGELDEGDPGTWDRYAAMTAASGIDVLMFNTYWCGRPVLHEALDLGYLESRGQRMQRFAVMWTNQPFADSPPLGGDVSGKAPYDWLSIDRPEEMWRSLAYLVTAYMSRPGYWRLQGRPFLAIWDARRLREILGVDGTRELLDELRAFARRCGHDGLHIQAQQASTAVYGDAAAMGFDSCGHYNDVLLAGEARPREEEVVDYGTAAADVVSRIWPAIDRMSPLPYMPAVSPGWDTTPRITPIPRRPDGGTKDRLAWPATLIVRDSNPAAFEALTAAGIGFLNQHPDTPPVLFLGCLNEWTEGQYLLPDSRWGTGWLDAVSSATGRGGRVVTPW